MLSPRPSIAFRFAVSNKSLLQLVERNNPRLPDDRTQDLRYTEPHTVPVASPALRGSLMGHFDTTLCPISERSFAWVAVRRSRSRLRSRASSLRLLVQIWHLNGFSAAAHSPIRNPYRNGRRPESSPALTASAASAALHVACLRSPPRSWAPRGACCLVYSVITQTCSRLYDGVSLIYDIFRE